MKSKALVKSTNKFVASSFFARTASRIQRILKICGVLDLFLRKPFWFFQCIFPILGSLRLRSRALYILAATDIRVITRYFLDNPRSLFVGKTRMRPFVNLSIVFRLYTSLQCRSFMSSNSLVFHTSRGISSSPAAFLFLISISTESSSSFVKCPSLMSNCLLRILVYWFMRNFRRFSE